MSARRVGPLVGMLALASVSWAGPPDRPGVAEMVRLALYVDRDSYYEREPVGFHVGVRNITDESLTIGLALSPFDEAEYFTVHYRRLGEAWVQLTYPDAWRNWPFGPVASHFQLAPGQEGRVAFGLAADPGRRTFLFDTPGDYDVRVVAHRLWAHPPDEVASPIVRVHIAPAPDDERRALEHFWDVPMATFVQNDGSTAAGNREQQAEAVLPRAMRFLEEYPHSLYARHALAGAARHVEDRVRSGKATPEEKALYRKWKDTQDTRP